jgi:hypothetical protein
VDFDKMAYPDEFEIAGQKYKGKRNTGKGQVLIPYTTTPTVGIGDRITQFNGPNQITLRVMDADFMQGGSLNVGTRHPHILTLVVQNVEREALTPPRPASLNIGTVSAHQVQIGDNNTMSIHISVHELVKQVASSGDAEAKGILRKLLENNSVAALLGAGTTALLSLL